MWVLNLLETGAVLASINTESQVEYDLPKIVNGVLHIFSDTLSICSCQREVRKQNVLDKYAKIRKLYSDNFAASFVQSMP